MSEYLGDAVLELSANVAPLRKGLASAESMTNASIRRMQGGVAGGMSKVSSGLNTVGTRLTHTVTVPIIGVGAAAAKMSTEFSAAMERIHTQAGAPQAEIGRLHDKVLALAKATAQSPQQLAEGLYHLESIGLRGQKALNALTIAAKGAAVGNADIESTATALGSAWLVNIKGAGSMSHVMGTLNAAVGVGNVRMGDLVTALGTGLLPAAKVAGLSLQDVLGALTVFTDEGYKANSASAQLATALHYLYDPTTKAAGALSQIGIGQGKLANDLQKPRGLLVALDDLKAHLDKAFPPDPGHQLPVDVINKDVETYRKSLEAAGVSGKKLTDQTTKYRDTIKALGTSAASQAAVLGDIFPAGRGRVLLTLMNQLNRYQMKLNQIGKNQKNFNQDFADTQQTAAFKARAAWDGLQASLIKFGDKVVPTLVKAGQQVVGFAEDAFNKFQSLPAGLQHQIITGGLITAGIGPAMRLLGMFTGGLAKFSSLLTVASRLGRGQGFAQAISGKGAGAAAMQSLNVDTMEVAELLAKSASVDQMMVGELVVRGATGLGGWDATSRGGNTGEAADGAAGAETRLAGAADGATVAVEAFGVELQRQLDLFSGIGESGTPMPSPVGRDPVTGRYTKQPQEQLPLFNPGEERGKYTNMLDGVAAEAPKAIESEIEKTGPGIFAKLGKGLTTITGRAMHGGLIAGIGLATTDIAAQAVGGNTGAAIKSVGTGVSLGAALGSMIEPGIGTGVGAGIGGGIAAAIHFLKGKSYGTKLADDMTVGFQGRLGYDLKSKIAKELDKASNLLTPVTHVSSHQFDPGRSGFSPNTPRPNESVSFPSAKDRQEAYAQQETVGRQMAAHLEKGWKSYKFQSESNLFSAFDQDAKKLPVRAQAAAAQSAVAFADKLEKEGRLPAGAAAKFIDQIERKFPALVAFMGTTAAKGSQAFARKLDLIAAERKLNSSLEKMTKDFPQVNQAFNNTAGNAQDKAQAMIAALLSINTKGSSKMRTQVDSDLLKIVTSLKSTQGRTSMSTSAMVIALQEVSKHGTGALKRDATNDLQNLRDSTLKDMQHMSNSIVSQTTAATTVASGKFARMGTEAQTSMGTVKTAAQQQMSKFQDAVVNAMANGTLTVGQGMSLIVKNTNAALKALGQKQLTPIQILSLQVKALGSSAFNGALPTLSSTPPNHKARGGLVQFGAPGAHGTDTIAANFGGVPVRVGSGEQGMVLTGPQQAFLNARTADVGGLGGMFRKLNRPHYMASGGFVADPGTNFSYGQEPAIVGRLGTLGSSLGDTIYGISGYRSPAHSVSVGGFADDPHTKGMAADIGVNSQLRESAAVLTRATLARFGLDRPFDESDDPGNSEVNHIQLLAGMSGAVGSAAAAATAAGQAANAVAASITAPKISGSGAWAKVAQGAMNKATSGANALLSTMGGIGGVGMGGIAPGSWLKVARQIAAKHGWGGDQVQAWEGVEQLEDGGYSLSATNPGSGAYGLAQFIDGAGEYAKYGGNSTSLIGQLTAMANYIAQRYGNPAGALAHEQSSHWYARGGFLPGSGRGAAPAISLTKKQLAAIKKMRHTPKGKKVKPHKGKGLKSTGHLGAGSGIFGVGGPFPFDTGDLGPIDATLSQILSLDGGDSAGIGVGGKGSIQNIWDQISWLTGTAFPNAMDSPNFADIADPSAFVLSTDAFGNSTDLNGNPIPPTLSGHLQPVIKELVQVIGMQGGGVDQLKSVYGLITGHPHKSKKGALLTTGLPGLMQRAIQRRQAIAKLIRERIRKNNERIKAIKAQIAKLQKKIKDTKTRMERGVLYLHPITPAQKAANTAFHDKPHSSLAAHPPYQPAKTAHERAMNAAWAAEKGANDGWSSGQTNQYAVWKGDLKKWQGELKPLTDSIKPLEAENRLLGGKSGTGGELGRIEAQLGSPAGTSPIGVALGTAASSSGLYSLVDTAKGWATTINGTNGDLPTQQAILKGWEANLAGLAPGANADLQNAIQQAAAAAAANTAAAPADNTTALTDVENQLAQQGQLQTDVLAAQYGVLQNAFAQLRLPPYAGSYDGGGVIPGPLGAARTAIVHGGEEVLTPEDRARGGIAHVILTKGPGVDQLIDARIEKAGRQTSRVVGYALPSRGGGR